jgi:hypothetical protein
MRTLIACGFALLSVLCIVALTACGPQREPDHLVGYQVHQVEIVAVNRPKHFNVDVRTVDTGAIYRGVGRSKHCNRHMSTAYLGRRLDVPFAVYERPDGSVYKTLNGDALNRLLCKS